MAISIIVRNLALHVQNMEEVYLVCLQARWRFQQSFKLEKLLLLSSICSLDLGSDNDFESFQISASSCPRSNAS